ncbi:signal transduction histidine kinase [Actinoplanes octamycinicus]|uniref:histidine kinase n=1 Tax=Actinoplanes octamycinicus TaxID=135948 RepID=A0A7W7M5T0_9ACTN|nr:sensor histidine kinase [Actinoplanes octamycinicus]MBB4737986.1 signal transduction histidine kinase [Actinoplanes octamycinicus]GIE58964.1 histidine kinase [Actinoplanes octamycinicus]
MRRRVRIAVDALEHLVGGLGTSILAMAGLFWLLAVVVLSLVGVGLLLVPGSLRIVRSIADRERGRLARWGPGLVGPVPIPDRPLAALRDPAVRRELIWVPVHATFGFVIGLFGLSLPLSAVQSLTFPFWYHLVPPGEAAPNIPFWTVDSRADSIGVALAGVGWLAVLLFFGGRLARAQAWPGRRLLGPVPGADLSLRVAELTATRAAALDAHAAELRRIERSLHDGTQNRLVAVTVLLGAARRAFARDPATGVELLDRAQQAAEQALGELRTVVRGILPPVLDDRGLAGALDGLVAGCALPCGVAVDLPVRCAVSVEATAYFVVAEALTNAVRHSGATGVTVSVRIDRDTLVIRVGDDGRGGADESAGTGLAGIRRRVEAHDGRFALTSPLGGPTTMDVELPCGS